MSERLKNLNFSYFARRICSIILILTVCLWAQIVFCNGHNLSNNDELNKTIEISLKQGDWETLLRTLKPEISKEELKETDKYHLYFLAGHASLTLNQNNEATVLFLVNEKEALEFWKNWTQDLKSRHPDWSVSHYLYGDALARLGDFSGAITEFTEALSISPSDALVMNARGIVYFLSEEKDNAIQDLLNARKNSKLADVSANLGVLDLQVGHDPHHARENFDEALQVDPSFAMALNGRACFFAKIGETKGFLQDIEGTEKACKNLPFAVMNRASYEGKNIESQLEKKHRGGSLQRFRLPDSITVSIGFPFLSIGATWNRGGLYVYMKEGENLIIDKEGNPRKAGTWFVLNYPQTTE